MLRFTPYAWAKLVYLRDLGGTEVGGFGLTETDDPSLVTDFALVRQTATSVSVLFEFPDLVDFLTAQAERGLSAIQCQRIWIHTHPGSSARPSHIDEENFKHIFDAPSWAVMFILARAGETYARLKFNVGPGGEQEIPVRIDWSVPFQAADHAGWKAEYERCVQEAEFDTVWGPDLPAAVRQMKGQYAREWANRGYQPARTVPQDRYQDEEFWWDDDLLLADERIAMQDAATLLGVSTDDLERMGVHTAEDLIDAME